MIATAIKKIFGMIAITIVAFAGFSYYQSNLRECDPDHALGLTVVENFLLERNLSVVEIERINSEQSSCVQAFRYIGGGQSFEFVVLDDLLRGPQLTVKELK